MNELNVLTVEVHVQNLKLANIDECEVPKDKLGQRDNDADNDESDSDSNSELPLDILTNKYRREMKHRLLWKTYHSLI